MRAKYDIKKFDGIITKLFLIILAIIVMLSFYGCTVYKTPKMQITSVLAVTAEGDTLKLPIDVIRPIYNYNNVTYPRTNYYPYHHNYYYRPNNNWKPIGNNNYNNNNNSNNSTRPVTPTIKPSGNVTTPPVPVNPRKNN
tara:strand:- start:351 stop:767 length:417 start_codon:yes stop_codon:yes gene_type:complete